MSQINRTAKTTVALLMLLLLTACGTQLGNSNWPGMSVSDDRIYIANGNSVIAVDPAAERLVWRYPEENSPAPLLAAPEIDADRLYLVDYGRSQGLFSPGVSASVYALDIDGATPQLAWQNEGVARDRIVAQPLAANGKLYVGTADNQLLALNAQSGDVIWTAQLGHSVWGQPSYANGIVVASSLDRSVHAFDADSGQSLWTTTLDGAIAAKPLIVNDTIYVSGFDAMVHALDLSSGKELWRSQPAADWIWNAPAIDTDRIFYADVQGNVFAANSRSGEQLWQTGVSGRIEAGLAYENDTVYVPLIIGRTTEPQSGQLIALNAETGAVRWQIDLPLPVYTTPALIDGQLAVLISETDNQDNYELRAFEPTEGRQLWVYKPTAE